MLRQPALLAGHARGDAQREALLAKQRVAAVAASRKTRSRAPRGSGRCTLFVIAGPGDVLLARLERRADRVEAGHELAVLAEGVEHRAPHAGHDAHVDHHVGRIRDLDADVGDVRAEWAHAEGNHVHACGRACSRRRGPSGSRFISSGSHPVVGRAGSSCVASR